MQFISQSLLALLTCSFYFLEALGEILENVPGSADGVYWFGQQRTEEQLNPDYHYDLIYDETLCDDKGLRSFAIENYVYLGQLLDAFPLKTSVDCAVACQKRIECRSANFYYHSQRWGVGQCELNGDGQSDNPDWMVPLKGAVYLHDIACQDDVTPELIQEPTDLKKDKITDVIDNFALRSK